MHALQECEKTGAPRKDRLNPFPPPEIRSPTAYSAVMSRVPQRRFIPSRSSVTAT